MVGKTLSSSTHVRYAPTVAEAVSRPTINHAESSLDTRTLWRKLGTILQPISTSVDAYSAQDFAPYFQSKIDGIRFGTLGAPAPSINSGIVPPLRRFEEVTSEEVSSIIRMVPSKHCQLNAEPTWLVKRLTNVLSQVIADMANVCFENGRFPTAQKQALLCPILKKPSMDPLDLKSYRPVSNLSFRVEDRRETGS